MKIYASWRRMARLAIPAARWRAERRFLEKPSAKTIIAPLQRFIVGTLSSISAKGTSEARLRTGTGADSEWNWNKCKRGNGSRIEV
jgi:hypothetical protein